MRKSHSTEQRLDCTPVSQVVLNLECRDEIIPILYALQHIYQDHALRDAILELIAADVNPESSSRHGRRGMYYWHILVLAAVRLGCNFDYDRLQDLTENHRALRDIMGVGEWSDEFSFTWRRIRDNLCLLTPATLARISQLIVQQGHQLQPEAATSARADSFVMETNIHYPSESSLIWDGVRTVVTLCVLVARELGCPGWRQHAHLLRKVKGLHRAISRAAASTSPVSKQKRRRLYTQLLKTASLILDRADTFRKEAYTTNPLTLARLERIGLFAARTRQVMDTARRRVLLGEQVPNEDKLFSIFEPHTQLYRRGKAGHPNQFGRLVLVFEDGAGFITHHYLLRRDELDMDVAVPQTRIVQQQLEGKIQTLSFDRGFYSEENEQALQDLVSQPCLPQRHGHAYVEQMAQASVTFRRARRRHSGVESAIGALQAGNGAKRCRDRTELGFERYLGLAILGRNLHVLGKLLIAQQSSDALAAYSTRAPAA